MASTDSPNFANVDTRVPSRGPVAEPAPETVRTLIDEFLADQADTTAVERFSRAHDAPESQPSALPAQARYYRDLLPATPPGPGQQYGFEVDLDACSGCKACVVACGSQNGLDAGQSFRRVGALVGAELPLIRSVTSACHHCVEPGCMKGCPVDAYEKDPVTGVVRHLDDQCIGCQYCTLTCPYEVPAYDRDRGIVRKCDMCHDRLADGEAPACVSACPTDAIAIKLVDVDAAVGQDAWDLPAPDPAITAPTTTYRTSEDLLSASAEDDTPGPAHAHPPLTVMLVLTQVSVGTLLALVGGLALASFADAAVPLPEALVLPAALTALTTAVVALAASVLHLGRPLLAWRAVIGLKHSWLSREIVAFGMFAPATAAYAATLAGFGPDGADRVLGPIAALAGLAGVGTSAMLYAVTGRRWWSLPRTAARFALTTVFGGLVALAAVTATVGAVTGEAVADLVAALALPASVLAVVIVGAEVALLRHRRDREIARTARLLRRQMPGVVLTRMGGALLGGAVGPWLAWRMLIVEPTSTTAAAVALLLSVAAMMIGEFAERWRFFTAVAPTRLPTSPLP